MALIKCPECGREISDTCNYCIHCGYRLKKENVSWIVEEDNTRVIAKRGTPGFVRFCSIFNIIFGGMLQGLFVIFGLILYYEYVFDFLPISAFGALFIVDGIILMSNIHNNSCNKKDCILLDENRNVLILYSLDGTRTEIKPEQFHKMYCNLFTDFKFLFRYRNDSGSIEKLTLGFTRDYGKVKIIINELAYKQNKKCCTK